MNDKKQYFYQHQGTQYGPFTRANFIQLAKDGIIKSDTLCKQNENPTLPATKFFGKSWAKLEAYNALNNQNSLNAPTAPGDNLEHRSLPAQPPAIPQKHLSDAPTSAETVQNPTAGTQNQEGSTNFAAPNPQVKEKKDRLKFRLEIAAAILAIIGPLIAIIVYFLPGNTDNTEPQSREEVAAIILQSLRDGDRDTFEQHVSVEILNAAGDGENLDKLFVTWQKDANDPGMTPEKFARIATFVKENEKWKLNER